MTAPYSITRGRNKRPTRFWPVLVSLVAVVALAGMWDRQVSGQTPTAQALGPYAADFLLRAGGELDGTSSNGAGARSLATGSTITTASTCFAAWCGTLTETAPVLLAGDKWYRTNVQYAPSSVTGTSDTDYTTWYAEGQYFFQVYRSGTFSASGTGALNIGNGCPYNYTQGEPVYWFRVTSSVTVCNFAPSYGWASTSWDGVTQAWSQFRGMGGANPSAPPTQDDANAWAQTQIDGGHWPDVVKPALDAVIRAAVTSPDLAAVGITGNPPIDQPPQARKIAIDAGHGSECPGTRGPTWTDREEVLVLEIAQQVKADFEARGHTVVWTRPPVCEVGADGKETQESLEGRADAALGMQAMRFVSIHHNGAGFSDSPTCCLTHPFTGELYDPGQHGTELWYSVQGDPTPSLALARRARDEQLLLGLSARPWAEPGIAISPTNGTIRVLERMANQMPSILDEVAFLTNDRYVSPPDETRLHDPVFRRGVANAIENAVMQSFP